MEKDLIVTPSKYLELLQEPINQKYYINKMSKASTYDGSNDLPVPTTY